jgi:hypothetical protein
MPELNDPRGRPVVLACRVAIPAGMLADPRHRGRVGFPRRDDGSARHR